MKEHSTDVDSITDIYVPSDDMKNGFIYPGRIPIPQSLYPLAYALVESVKKKRLNNCTVSHAGLAFRAHVMPTAHGSFFIFRRMPSRILTPKELGLPSVISNSLMSRRLLKGGLIMISGLPGNGKSTTLGSVVVERLKKFGGICITVEDPVEMPLQGNHGSGLCLQRSIASEEEFAPAIRDALRAYPAKTAAMMMIGEIRDSESAALALRSAVDGRLVLLTMHAGNVIQSIQRLCTMASRVIPMEETRELLASSFRLAMYQRLDTSSKRTGNKLKVSTLMDTLAVAGTIRQKNISLENLQNEVAQQLSLLRNGKAIELRDIE